MNRRTLLLGGGAAVLAVTASAGIFDDIKLAITGHVEDAKSRVFAEDNFIPGKTTKSGKFNEEASGQDAAHWAVGTISIVESNGKKYIQFGNDFNSGPLPDGHVYYSLATGIEDESDFFSSKQVEVGKLKQGKGAHYYEVPIDAKINSVTVWCKAFSQYIGSADVRKGA